MCSIIQLPVKPLEFLNTAPCRVAERRGGINLLGFFMFIVYPVITETGLFSGAASFAFLRQFEGNSRQKVDGNCAAEDTASLQPAAAPAGPIRIMTRSASSYTRGPSVKRKILQKVALKTCRESFILHCISFHNCKCASLERKLKFTDNKRSRAKKCSTFPTPRLPSPTRLGGRRRGERWVGGKKFEAPGDGETRRGAADHK